MADHRIRLTDRELALAKSATNAMCVAMMVSYPDLAHEYAQVANRLEHTKPGGMPGATRAARKHFRMEAPAP